MRGPCLICPDCVCRRLSNLTLKLKALSLVIVGLCVCILAALCIQNLSLQPNFTGDYSSYLWHDESVENLPPPGPWQFAGLWIGKDALVNSTIVEDIPDDVKIYTGNEVPYLEQNLTSAKHSLYRLGLLASNAGQIFKVGDAVQFLIEARDQNGLPQSLGGDYWTGVLKDLSQKAFTSGRLTDFKNGTYLMTFIVPWSGEAEVEIKLIYPSRITNWLRTRYRADNHYPAWHGTFKRGRRTKTSHCYVSYGRIPNNVCEYRHYRALTHTRFFCKRPAGFACGHLVGHRNVLPYGKVVAEIMKADHFDIYDGIERFKVIAGQPSTITVKENNEGKSAASHLQLPSCGTDMTITTSDGYWMNDTWTSLICQPNLEYSAPVIKNCLRNHHVHLTGDSTTRQWYFSLMNALDVTVPGGDDKTKMKYKYFSDQSLNLNVTFTFHPLTYQISFIVNISEMRFEVDVLLNLPPHTCNHVIVISPWTHFMVWPWEAYIEWLTNIKSAITEARRKCPGIKVVIKSPHALENEQTSRSMMGVDILFRNMKQEMRNIFQGSGVYFVDIWDMDEAYPVQNDMHMPGQVINQEIALFLSYICH